MLKEIFHESCENFEITRICMEKPSLRGRRLKGKGKGVLGAREVRGAREEGGRETPARKPSFFSFLTSTR